MNNSDTCPNCLAARGPCETCSAAREAVAAMTGGHNAAALVAAMVGAGAAVASGALDDAHEARARAVVLERELVRAVVRHRAEVRWQCLTAPRSGLVRAWAGQGLMGRGLAELRPRARWAELLRRAEVMCPDVADEMRVIRG